MLTLISLTPLISLSIIFYSRSYGQNSSCWRSSILSASIVWGVLLTAITEFLSIFNSITLVWVLGFWGLANLISAYICIHVINKKKPIVWFKISKTLPSVIPLLIGVTSIATLVGIVALMAPPNNWDSMTYHMSRVMHWMQNKNVGHYLTHIDRQLYLQPWTEFAIMNFQILSGGDRFANLVQWFSMVGSLFGVSLIAKHLGANLRTQIFAAVIAVTIPMGILQASSTQNDYVVSFWLVCFVYYLLCLDRQPAKLGYSVLAGIALGLALLTKATAYIYCFPFLLWISRSCFQKTKSNAVRTFSIIILLALLINSGHYWRNYEAFNHPLGEDGYRKANCNALIIPSAVISNIIRNISLHCGAPNNTVNGISYHSITLIHKLLNIDLNDSRTTFQATKFQIPWSQHEDNTGNFVHLILFAVAVFYYFIFLRHKKYDNNNMVYYAASVITAFIMLCALIKWNPWNSRYHLPLFVLGAPFIAITLSEIQNPFKQNKKMLIFIWVIFICAIAGGAWYGFFGHKFVAAIYEGKSTGFLNRLIVGQTTHLPGYYFKIADKMFWQLLGAAVCFLLSLILLFRTKREITNLICFIIILASLPWVFHNQSRKLIGAGNIFTVRRIDQYFCNRPNLKDPYIGVVDYVKSNGCSKIGIILGGDDWEYPFFALLQKSNPQGFRIEHINVNNISKVKYNTHHFDSFDPCAIISVRSSDENEVVNKNVVYIKKWSSDPVSVFIKK